ncbi:MAG: hypothetical protein JEZ12_15925 [Desulfobacterium sp.]|nr:hypothetical protein [Desulfobacterium sp.]
MKIKKILLVSFLFNFILACGLGGLLHRLGGIKYVIFKATVGDSATGVSAGRTDFFRLVDDAEGEIIFLGDSLTEQVEWSEVYHDLKIKNRGIGGNRATQILKRLDEVVASKPQKIFLMAGINDLVSDPKEKVVKTLKQIATNIRESSPETNIYVQSILPVNNSIRDSKRSNADIQFINNQLEAFCQGDSHFIWVDLYASFVDNQNRLNPDCTYDGLHLNGAGCMKWCDIVSAYL